MAICCTVCGGWYEHPGRDTLDICEGCWPNFSGASPPLAWPEVSAREALEAYVSSGVTLTPRQVQALWRMHLRQAGEEDGCPRS